MIRAFLFCLAVSAPVCVVDGAGNWAHAEIASIYGGLRDKVPAGQPSARGCGKGLQKFP